MIEDRTQSSRQQHFVVDDLQWKTHLDRMLVLIHNSNKYPYGMLRYYISVSGGLSQNADAADTLEGVVVRSLVQNDGMLTL